MYNEGFKPEYFEKLVTLEEKNFWFKIRNKIIIHILKKYIVNMQSFLEIGCGTGFVTSAIAKAFPEATPICSEYFNEGLLFTQKRLPRAQCLQMDARNIPYESHFCLIGAFDVIEHIKEDTIVLRQMHKALKPEGWILITVPQHQWLWSSIDEIACHERRYSAKNLHTKIKDAGFEIILSTSFVTTLLPFMAILNKRCGR